MNLIRVLIADDHALVRAGIRALVEKIDDMVVVGEAGRGSEALELVTQLKPNLMLLDITMPDGGGFDVLDQVTKKHPDIRVIVLTVHEAGEYAIRALREGAPDFCQRVPRAPNSNWQSRRWSVEKFISLRKRQGRR